MKNDNPFVFNAHGCALSGFTTRPWGYENLKTVASVSLGSTGGKGNAKEPYSYHAPFLVVGSAETTIEGKQESSGPYSTKLTMAVDGLEMYDLDANKPILRATFVMSIATSYANGGKETSVDFSGTQFHSLWVDGADVEMDLSTMFAQAPTYDEFDTKFGSSPKVCKSTKGRMMRCSLLDKVRHKDSQPKGDQQILVVPNFGTLYLGEVHLKDNGRRLTMMRMELGSPVAGAIALGDGSGNGTSFP